MKDEQILKKAIEKAAKNGYKYPYVGGVRKSYELEEQEIMGIIFSHSFAKAFWPTQKCEDCPDPDAHSNWQWHLSQMVKEEQPLKYIEKFLTE